MRRFLHNGIRKIEILVRGEYDPADDFMEFQHEFFALNFIRSFVSSPLDMMTFRDVFAEALPFEDISGLTDHEVLKRLAWQIVCGNVKLLPHEHEVLSLKPPGGSPPSTPPGTPPGTPPTTPPGTPPGTPPTTPPGTPPTTPPVVPPTIPPVIPPGLESSFEVEMVTVSAYFAPGTEKLDIKYKITDPAGVIASAKLEVLDSDGTVVHTVTLGAADRTNGDHELKEWWDGKKSDNTYISFDKSPYKVRISATGASGSKSSEKETKVELDSLGTLLRGQQLENVGGNYRVYFERNQRAGDSITKPAIFLVEATLQFKSKNASETVTTPIRTRLDWTFEDPDCELGLITNAKAKTYVTNAANYKKGDTTPVGDNCHVDRGGKRGNNSHHYFRQHSGFNLSADGAPSFHANAKSETEDSGTFDVKTTAEIDTLSSLADRHHLPVKDLNEVNSGLGGGALGDDTTVQIPRRGKSVIEFVASNIANDNYKVIVTVHDKNEFRSELDVVTVWRKVPIGIMQRMVEETHTCDSHEGTLSSQYVPANTFLDLPENTDIPAQNPMWPYPPAFPHVARESFPPTFEGDDAYTQDIIIRSEDAEMQYIKDIYPGNDIQIVWAHIMRKEGGFMFLPGPDGTTRVNEGGEQGEQEGGGYSPGTNRIVVYHKYKLMLPTIISHEMGHLLNLRHQTGTASGANMAFPADHDPADAAPLTTDPGGCIMRALANSDHFCGKCILKLWGWNITAPELP